ncbi:hypothetical protein C0Q70_17530 [Pomacea canaliculata]|uniref:EF-hand domain-containing protein n=1 Tax=Pomacea canaliculata TaxID=400727 RepID=A0A2T7NKN3_POMCA|nr:hypothetical protein C0Q70_17530 [Pomacea canaliculata]
MPGAYLVLVTLESERQITCTRHALTFNDQLTVTSIQLASRTHNTDFSEHIPADTNKRENTKQQRSQQLFDKNISLAGDGFASLEEFKAYLPADVPQAKLQGSFKFYDKTDGEDDNKVSREVASKVFDNLDLNDDSEIPFEEFMQTYPLLSFSQAHDTDLQLSIPVDRVSHDAVQDTFKNLDKDHDGILHEKEFFSFFDSIDTNGDDFLSHDEFTGAEEATLKEKTIAIFNFYDRLDGTVDQRVSRKLPHIMFSRLDHDGNGEIPYSEYQHSYPLVTELAAI